MTIIMSVGMIIAWTPYATVSMWAAWDKEGPTHPWVSTHTLSTLSEENLSPLYIFILVNFELSLYSWIAGLYDVIQWSELFLLRV